VGHFTLDNASNNGSGMRELERLLINRGIKFDEYDNRVMCVPSSSSSVDL
jgi:hypothetical protein